ncbi:hypothetical protein [Homoserinibacter sp. YIM 151385]|uniref:hypothetical protein n=1 Tax=Homoserinibacter sp. YIM 151385 TaxID=2985506 RepID=UPI0022F0BD5E|nr:hypothetical protein [Homoserinibacter sp. YIM 151385]WBU37341.1 hypothetical protein OF852_10500 [Homoserinibacter sp. YIM 151385]
MTDRREPGDEDDARDWLSAQFGEDGDAESAPADPASPAPAEPAPPTEAVEPPALVEPGPVGSVPASAVPGSSVPGSPESTQPMSQVEPEPTQPAAIQPGAASPASPGPALPAEPALSEPPQSDPLWFSRLTPKDEAFPEDVPAELPEEPTALDELFAEGNFADYEDEPDIAAPASGRRAAGPAGAGAAGAAGAAAATAVAPPKAPADPLSRRQRILMWVAGGAIALLALVIIFVLGLRSGQSAPQAVPAPTPSASAEPEEAQPALLPGPVEPGETAWADLRGGECLTSADPWASVATVVDCAEPHAAQLVMLQTLKDVDPESAYPGVDSLGSTLAKSCAGSGVLDMAVAGDYDDVQLQPFFPVESEWGSVPRYAGCVASRESGELEASIIGGRQASLVAAAEKAFARQQESEGE